MIYAVWRRRATKPMPASAEVGRGNAAGSGTEATNWIGSHDPCSENSYVDLFGRPNIIDLPIANKGRSSRIWNVLSRG